MNERTPSRLSVVASLVMIAASVYLFWTAHEVKTRGPAIAVLKPYEIGEDLRSVTVLRPLADQRLLLMWIQSTCRFCTGSMPFYRRIAADDQRSVRLVALGPEPEAVIRSYLAQHGVRADFVLTAPPDMRLYSTPTLLLLTPGLKVSSVWKGQLSAEQEHALESSLALGRPTPQ